MFKINKIIFRRKKVQHLAEGMCIGNLKVLEKSKTNPQCWKVDCNCKRIEREGDTKTIDVVLTPRFLEEGGDVMLDRYRETENLGKYASSHNSGFPEALQHDTDLFPHQCGGPLFDISGKAIGLNIARAARITSYALPASAVTRVYEQLKAKPLPARLKKGA